MHEDIGRAKDQRKRLLIRKLEETSNFNNKAKLLEFLLSVCLARDYIFSGFLCR